jgi:uncharacterized protein (DUF924 family)
MADSDTILEYWFGSIPQDQPYAAERLGFWFLSDHSKDREVAQQFGAMIRSAQTGAAPHAQGTARETLASLLLLGRLPRIVYRGRPEAYAGDEPARRLAMRCHFDGRDRLLRPVERVFMYLPLIDCENPEAHRRGLDAFSHLYQSVPSEWQPAFAPFLDEALRRFDLIERFGRFPERNPILERPSTPDELGYLETMANQQKTTGLNPGGAL